MVLVTCFGYDTAVSGGGHHRGTGGRNHPVTDVVVNESDGGRGLETCSV